MGGHEGGGEERGGEAGGGGGGGGGEVSGVNGERRGESGVISSS
jgi:hypothetical protein